MSSNVIAIDGPAASGKSTLARKLAAKLDIPYISTGAIFRAVAWKFASLNLTAAKELPPETVSGVLNNLSVTYRKPSPDAAPEVSVDGNFPGDALRTAEISALASDFATLPQVRDFVLAIEHSLAEKRLVVMEGRDIGSAVFPDAKYKFFITASPEERAKRRILQDGIEPTAENISAEAERIRLRDEQDTTRPLAPLLRPADAVFIDNTLLTFGETLEKILSCIGVPGEMKQDVVLQYRVPYADTDAMGVVYYANYLKYFEMFRTEYLIAQNLSYLEMEKRGVMMPVVEAVCRYRKSARFEDMLSLTGRISECSGVRVKLSCEVRRGDELLAEGYTIHACMDSNTRRPVRVPGVFLNLMKKGE